MNQNNYIYDDKIIKELKKELQKSIENKFLFYNDPFLRYVYLSLNRKSYILEDSIKILISSFIELIKMKNIISKQLEDKLYNTIQINSYSISKEILNQLSFKEILNQLSFKEKIKLLFKKI